MQYNVKSYDYGDGVNVSLYSKLFTRKDSVSSSSVQDEDFYIDEDGWIHVSESFSGELGELPFSAGTTNNSLFTKAFKAYERSLEAETHCKNVSLSNTKKSVFHIARSNSWEYFVTLTFDQKRYRSDDYDVAVSYLSGFLSELRRKFPEFGYLFIPELHDDMCHYHFHGLIYGVSGLNLVDSGHFFNGEPVYNWLDWKYGFSNLTAIDDQKRVTGYITKYITKTNAALLPNKKRYYASRNVNRVQPDFDVLAIPQTEFLKLLSSRIKHATGKRIEAGKFTVNYLELDICTGEKGENSGKA